ncbi:uncharacterized protein EI90DRAFT_2919117 [Cantharellus anzutake]|uniref:uncharacterized protein n=1 Tax=Cantharellus anzutake TaxID=1750568 RepID=UPI0019043C59|nr:uncharacterized protein EI90DRAFT_2919117 [Cantharellus anzutake]KAF8331913.1 hypothetical protein EI90DRAFT_2919117 [Cantharellus anzutake]
MPTPRVKQVENLYDKPQDFRELSCVYPPLQPFLFEGHSFQPSINFKDPQAQRRLTEALLFRDFGLSLELPEGRLCPAVPNRFEYVRWIREIVRCNSESSSGDKSTLGLDIGTGASAIYPLLACSWITHWKMIGTEIDDVSFQYALQNVTRNHLQTSISIRKSTAEDQILHPLWDDSLPRSPSFTFTMCNPPFYCSNEDMVRSGEAKDLDPHAVCTGAEAEMITPGGDAAFVLTMLEESLLVKQRCNWFTSLLGKLSSVNAVVERLREKKIDNYAIREIVQGQTRRWAVAWSFMGVRLSDSIAHASSPSLKALLPLPTTLKQPLKNVYSAANLADALHTVLGAIDTVTYTMECEGSKRGTSAGPLNADSEHTYAMHVSYGVNTWSRAARRRKKHATRTGEVSTPAQTPVSKMTIYWSSPLPTDKAAVTAQWNHGLHRTDFEGLWSHICKKLEDRFGP